MPDSVTDSGVWRPLERSIRWLTRRLAIHENVNYGHDFRVGRSVVISSAHKLMIGDWVSVGPRSIIQTSGEIGDFCLIGMGVQIVGRDDHRISEVGSPVSMSTWIGERELESRDSVIIGRDVWVGGGSTILSGVRIGDGAIIGSASVVTKDIPPFAIAVGNPARVVAMRFDEHEHTLMHLRALDALAAARRSQAHESGHRFKSWISRQAASRRT